MKKVTSLFRHDCYLKKILLCLLAGMILSSEAFSQNSYVPTIVPKAPDAAALMKFTEIPVSPYTGASSVSVPIYTVKAKGVTIPVSVDYHTGGIRLEEEASSTGLGWALTAGGMISRTINDKDDLGGLYFGTTIPQKEGNLTAYQPSNGVPVTSDYNNLDSLVYYECPLCSVFYNCPGCPVNGNRYIFEFQCSYKVNFTGGTGDYFNDFGATGADHPYDEEPDTYSFNFLGRSGKFIILRDQKTIVMEKQDNLRIQFLQDTGYYFRITDESGNKYYFKTTQTSHPAWMASATPTSWYLSRVITQQKDTVNFTYSGNGFSSVASETTQNYTAFGQYSGMNTQTNTGTVFGNVNLSKIDYRDGQIQFFYDSLRQDLSGGYKLDSIRTYSKTSAGLKYLKSNKFYYTYFQPLVVTNALEQKRLRLDSVKEFAGGAPIKPYSFVYNAYPAVNPEKHSFSIDHWGYYNGAGNSVLIPTTSAYYMGNNYNVPPTQFNYSGANRDPAFPNTQCMSLRRVNYPTGGSSIFTYEANTYDYNKSITTNVEYPQQVLVNADTTIHIQHSNFTGGNAKGVIDFSKIYPVIPDNVAGYNARIYVTFKSSYITGWPPADTVGFGKLQFNFMGNITDLSTPGLVNSGPVRTLNYQYTINRASDTLYKWTAHWDSTQIPAADFDEIEVRVTFQELKTVAQSNPTLTAGGLRIQSIVDSTATGIAKKRTWNYHYGSTNQYSNGLLMAFPSYVRMEQQQVNGGGNTPVMVLFSSSYTPVSSTIGGNIVGYSHVTETTVDPSSGADNGKIVYSYINTVDTIINYNSLRYPGIPNMGNNLNGSEVSRITYRNNAGSYWKLAETDNHYFTTNRKVYYSAKYRTSVRLPQSGACNIPGQPNVEDQGIAEFFPSIKSERVLQDLINNYVYDPADTTKYLLTTTQNFYDDTAHYLVTRVRTTDSKGNIHVTKMTYPLDYTISPRHTGNAILDSLIGHNMVAETIEKRDSLYLVGSSTGNVIAANESRYKQLADSVMVHDKEYRLDITNPVNNFVPMSISGNTYNQDSRYRQLISFDQYDNANNIAKYTLTNELPVSIIWDYKKVSPIAQVKNADTLSIAYTSFEADGKGGWTFTSSARDVVNFMTGTQSYNMTSGSISKSGLTAATTYVVSYWTKNSSAYTISGTITGYPIKGATINGWTYFEHKVTGVTGVSITGTGNIDELRLYPQNAQMTSYTYMPGVGVTTISDARGGINYYEYDNFQRLMNIKDQNGNILKSFDYHYANN